MSDNPKRSRFDRGTRKSPSPRRRSRSPERGNGNAQPVQAGEAKPADDAVAAAAKAAAARITAQIEARKAAGLDVAAKPVSPFSLASLESRFTADKSQTPSLLSAANKSSSAAKNEIYEQDGDFIKDIEVNDLRNRYTLTKGATQKMVNMSLPQCCRCHGHHHARCTCQLACYIIGHFASGQPAGRPASQPAVYKPRTNLISCYSTKAHTGLLAFRPIHVPIADISRVTSRSKKRPALVRIST